MEIKTVWSVWFSATGTTQKVVTALSKSLAQQLGTGWKEYSFNLPKAREEDLTFGPEDLVVLGVPVYAGRVPNVLLPYLRSHLHGSGGAAIPVVLFGNRNFDDALIELRDILAANGLRAAAGAAFVGEHSFSRVLAAGRPDGEDMAHLSAFAVDAAEKIRALKAIPEEPAAVRGETPIRPYYQPRDRQGNPVNILKVKPLTDMEKCDNCGLCARLCPMGSIDAADASQITGICIKCCACVKKCPKGAKYYTDEKYLYHQHELEEGFARRAEPEVFL